MRALFWVLAVFAAAVALVILGRAGAGYVMLVYPPYRVELSMLFFVTASLASFLLLYAALRLLGHTVSLPTYVRAYRARRRRERAHAALAAALQAYYEGRYARVEKEAAVAFEAGPAPGLAALLAARAAHQMRDFERRDRWLERAEEEGEGLHAAGPKHIATTRMLLRAERGAGAWDEVLRLATQLAKRDAIAPALAEECKVQANVELLRRSASYPGAFERRWRGIPAPDQLQPRVAAAAARHAATLGKTELARDIIEKALAAEWTPQLVALYGDLPPHLEPAERAAEARARIERGERWLLEHERDAQLLAVLGRLCTHAELWGKARSFLEASLSFEEGRGARLDLARLAERLGQAAEAERHYRRAAELT